MKHCIWVTLASYLIMLTTAPELITMAFKPISPMEKNIAHYEANQHLLGAETAARRELNKGGISNNAADIYDQLEQALEQYDSIHYRAQGISDEQTNARVRDLLNAFGRKINWRLLWAVQRMARYLKKDLALFGPIMAENYRKIARETFPYETRENRYINIGGFKFGKPDVDAKLNQINETFPSGREATSQ
jgi:hypothetical protein